MSLEQFEISEEQLKDMSQESLFELYRLLRDHSDAVEATRHETYLKTAHTFQMAYHEARNRVRVFLGGNRSGKTTAGVMELLYRVRGGHPSRIYRTPIRACIVVQDFTTHAKDIIEPKIQMWFPPGFIVRTETNHAGAISKYYCANGSIIDVKSHDQDLKVFEGSDYDYVWFDEPPPHSIFVALWRSMVDRDGECSITGTPIVEAWMYDLVQEAEKEGLEGLIWYTYVNSYANVVNLGEGDAELGTRRLQDFEKLLDPDERLARIEGKFAHLKGLIFKTWNRSTHYIQPFAWPAEWPIWYSIDPHEEKDWAVSFIGFTEGKNVILLHSEQIPGVISEVAERILEIRSEIVLDDKNAKPRITRGLIDNAANKPLMEKRKPDGQKLTALEELNSYLHPYMPKAKPAPKNVSEKILIMKQWLHPRETKFGLRPKFRVFENDANQRFRYEIEHFRWKSYSGKNKNKLKSEPIKEDDDVLDTVLQVALAVGKDYRGDDEDTPNKEIVRYGTR